MISLQIQLVILVLALILFLTSLLVRSNNESCRTANVLFWIGFILILMVILFQINIRLFSSM